MTDYNSYLSYVNKIKNNGNNSYLYNTEKYDISKNYYNATVIATRAAFLQHVTDDMEYYNSDDENEPLQIGPLLSPPPPLFPLLSPLPPPLPSPPYNISQKNNYNIVSNKYKREVGNYSQNICNLKYKQPSSKIMFSLAYRKQNIYKIKY